MTRTPTLRAAIVVAVSGLLLTTSPGCVQRYLDFTSEPSGAFVFLDGRPVGRTPVRVEFHHYGVHEVILRHPGLAPSHEPGAAAEGTDYRAHRETIEISAPWFQIFPIDLITEHLWPGGLVDRHPFHYRLTPYDPAEGQEAFEDAAREAGLYGAGDPAP